MDGIIFGGRFRPGPLNEWAVWTGRMDDGTSMAVLKGIDKGDALAMAAVMRGVLATVTELPGLPLPPDYPRPDGLKNRVCLAETVMARYIESDRVWDFLTHPAMGDRVRGVSSTDYGLFVEFGSERPFTIHTWDSITGRPMALWAARVTSWSDVRVPVGA